MKRLFAMLALLAGGLANEAVHPLVCTLTTATRRENLEPNDRRRRLTRRPAQRGV
jgi:hypothetical protein